jgi:glucose/arabinose dehydrogenase
VAVAVVLGAACSGSDDDPESEPRDQGEPTTTTAPLDRSEGAPDAQSRLDAADVTLTPIAELTDPTALAVRPGDDTLYVAEQIGRVRAVRDGSLVDAPFLDLTDGVRAGGEQGLLGIAFSPEGDKLYAHYSNSEGDNQIDEFAMEGRTVDRGSQREVITVEGLQPNHNGGQIAFGPDGLLYIGYGDGGGAGDQGDGHAPEGNGQSLDTLLGKIVRIDPQPSGDRPYTIPADNPFADGGGDAEIWAYGLRNPWRFSWDRETDDLWIGDVGQNAWEEIDFVPGGEGAGANFGWPQVEANAEFRGAPPGGHAGPILDLSHDDGHCSVISGYVYRGANIPELEGAHLFSDYCNTQIRAIVEEDGQVVADRTLLAGPDLITAFGEDNDGELYVLSQRSGLLRLDPG